MNEPTITARDVVKHIALIGYVRGLGDNNFECYLDIAPARRLYLAAFALGKQMTGPNRVIEPHTMTACGCPNCRLERLIDKFMSDEIQQAEAAKDVSTAPRHEQGDGVADTYGSITLGDALRTLGDLIGWDSKIIERFHDQSLRRTIQELYDENLRFGDEPKWVLVHTSDGDINVQKVVNGFVEAGARFIARRTR